MYAIRRTSLGIILPHPAPTPSLPPLSMIEDGWGYGINIEGYGVYWYNKILDSHWLLCAAFLAAFTGKI